MTIEDYIRQNITHYAHEDIVLPFKIELISFPKDDIITDYGQIEDKVYFLNQGLVQITILRNEEEKIVEFFKSGEFFSSYTSLLTQHPSDIQVVTLTNCNVSVIKRQDLLDAYSKSILASNLGLYVTQKLYLSRIQREKDFLTKPADVRYKELVLRNPELTKLVSMNKIAKYLGIQPESLSRIRKFLDS
jgi:CRP-like cAMP-binding protein